MTRADDPIVEASAAPSPVAPRGTLAHVRRPAPPRSRTYLRLLWLIPAVAVLIAGLWGYRGVEPGGTVTAVKLMTKQGPVGQANEAVRNVLGTYDLFLKIKTKDGWIETEKYKNLAVGSGRTWELPREYPLGAVKEVDVWDDGLIKDKNLDHITLPADQWTAEGQLFRIELQGKANEPPKWALPVLTVGATLTGLVLLRFVWDQVV